MPELVDVAKDATVAMWSSKQLVYAIGIDLAHGLWYHEVAFGEIWPENTELM